MRRRTWMRSQFSAVGEVTKCSFLLNSTVGPIRQRTLGIPDRERTPGSGSGCSGCTSCSRPYRAGAGTVRAAVRPCSARTCARHTTCSGTRCRGIRPARPVHATEASTDTATSPAARHLTSAGAGRRAPRPLPRSSPRTRPGNRTAQRPAPPWEGPAAPATRRRRRRPGWGGLLAGHAVDAFPQQIRVAVVSGVLLDHVDQDPAQRHRHPPLPVHAGHLQRGGGGFDLSGQFTL